MATEPPYPRCFNITLKDDSTKNFNIEIHKRVVDGPDMEQKVTEKVCRTFGINSRDVQSVLFYENRLNRPFTYGADDLVDAHTNAACQSEWKAGDPPFILPLEVQFTYSNVPSSNLNASTVVSLTTVEQQQLVSADERHTWLDTEIRSLMVLHLSGDEEWGVYFPCKVPAKAKPRLRYQGIRIQHVDAMTACRDAVINHARYIQLPIGPAAVTKLIKSKINNQRKFRGPQVYRNGRTYDKKDERVIAEMQRRRRVKEGQDEKYGKNRTFSCRNTEARQGRSADMSSE